MYAKTCKISVYVFQNMPKYPKVCQLSSNIEEEYLKYRQNYSKLTKAAAAAGQYLSYQI